MKKLIALFLILTMTAALAIPVLAAESASAGTMRLEAVEGTVAVKSASGLSVKLSDKMRLYNGYSIQTKANSYAYISLDGSKTLKLGASSEVSVSKSGRKLEVTLVSGSMFFNAAKPLQKGESLNIRTSTMVTGVRGTAGCVEAPDRDHADIELLTGHLEVTGRDPSSGRTEMVELSAGEHVTVAQREAGTPQESLEIRKETVQESELPGFVAVEVAKDPTLQERIAAETGLSVPLIVEDAEERLADEETAAGQEEAAVQEQLEEQERELGEARQESVDPIFEPEPDDPAPVVRPAASAIPSVPPSIGP